MASHHFHPKPDQQCTNRNCPPVSSRYQAFPCQGKKHSQDGDGYETPCCEQQDLPYRMPIRAFCKGVYCVVLFFSIAWERTVTNGMRGQHWNDAKMTWAEKGTAKAPQKGSSGNEEYVFSC